MYTGQNKYSACSGCAVPDQNLGEKDSFPPFLCNRQNLKVVFKGKCRFRSNYMISQSSCAFLSILSPSCGLQGSFAKGDSSSCCSANPAFSVLTAHTAGACCCSSPSMQHTMRQTLSIQALPYRKTCMVREMNILFFLNFSYYHHRAQ